MRLEIITVGNLSHTLWLPGFFSITPLSPKPQDKLLPCPDLGGEFFLSSALNG